MWNKTEHGEVAEWSNAPVLKTGVRQRTGGSNPSLSAIGEMTERSIVLPWKGSVLETVP